VAKFGLEPQSGALYVASDGPRAGMLGLFAALALLDIPGKSAEKLDGLGWFTQQGYDVRLGDAAVFFEP
jgi:hypothetical protein